MAKVWFKKNAFEKRLLKLGDERVIVGVLDRTTKSAKPSWKKGISHLKSRGEASVERRYVNGKGRKKNLELYRVARILDGRKGIISGAMDKASNKDVIAVAQAFARMDKTPKDIKRLENASKAIIKNPILRKEYNPNKSTWAKRKGFNHWGFTTGTLFRNIKAVFRRGR